MANFVTPDDFNDTPYSVPAKQLQSDSFQAYIDKQEPIILKKLLGVTLYNQFIEALEEDYPDQKWVDLRDGAIYEFDEIEFEWVGMKELLVPFFYSKWTKDNYDTHNETGITFAQVENAVNLSPALRIVTAWNDFHGKTGNCWKQQGTLYGFLKANESDYPAWVFTDVGAMNRFNL